MICLAALSRGLALNQDDLLREGEGMWQLPLAVGEWTSTSEWVGCSPWGCLTHQGLPETSVTAGPVVGSQSQSRLCAEQRQLPGTALPPSLPLPAPPHPVFLTVSAKAGAALWGPVAGGLLLQLQCSVLVTGTVAPWSEL